MGEDEKSNSVNRRNVLKGIGGTTAASSFTGAASAQSDSGEDAGEKREELNRVREAYSDPEALASYINGYGTFVSTLAREGLLEGGRIEIDELLNACDYLESETGAKVWGVDHPADGEPTAHVTVRRETQQGRLTVAFDPGRDNARPRAILKPEIPERGGESVPATTYRVTRGGGVDKARVEVNPKRPGEMDSEGSDSGQPDDQGSVAFGGRTGSADTQQMSIQSTVAYLCRNRGGDNCGSYSCYSWETQCFDETSCDIIDCTGSACCGGCCCCQDQDRCCTICGTSSFCATPPGCFPNSYICSAGCTTCSY